jgi:hypothetical protein
VRRGSRIYRAGFYKRKAGVEVSSSTGNDRIREEASAYMSLDATARRELALGAAKVFLRLHCRGVEYDPSKVGVMLEALATELEKETAKVCETLAAGVSVGAETAVTSGIGSVSHGRSESKSEKDRAGE